MNTYPRSNYEMSEDQLAKLIEACKPVPYIMVGGLPPTSTQENANNGWSNLGLQMGFDSTTVQPRRGFDTKHFSAIPSETENQRELRLNEEQAKKDFDELASLNTLIETTQNRISEIEAKTK